MTGEFIKLCEMVTIQLGDNFLDISIQPSLSCCNRRLDTRAQSTGTAFFGRRCTMIVRMLANVSDLHALEGFYLNGLLIRHTSSFSTRN